MYCDSYDMFLTISECIIRLQRNVHRRQTCPVRQHLVDPIRVVLMLTRMKPFAHVLIVCTASIWTHKMPRMLHDDSATASSTMRPFVLCCTTVQRAFRAYTAITHCRPRQRRRQGRGNEFVRRSIDDACSPKVKASGILGDS